MEEAEHLADRIGIMANGQILTIGSSNFIKKTFGVGYHLKINAKQTKKETDDGIDDNNVFLSQEKILQLTTIVSK